MDPKTLVFIGRSGCGKGTQAKLIIDYIKSKDKERKLYYLESGEEFRKLIFGDSYTSRLSRKIYEAGGLQPEFLAVWVWSHLFIENVSGDEHLIIDGTPRKQREAYVLDSAFTFYKREEPQIIYLNVSREWSTIRLTNRGRSDDNPGDIDARMNWFDSEVLPAVNFFKDHIYYKVHEINGEQTIEEVHEEILKSLGWSR